MKYVFHQDHIYVRVRTDKTMCRRRKILHVHFPDIDFRRQIIIENLDPSLDADISLLHLEEICQSSATYSRHFHKLSYLFENQKMSVINIVNYHKKKDDRKDCDFSSGNLEQGLGRYLFQQGQKVVCFHRYFLVEVFGINKAPVYLLSQILAAT